MRFTDKTAVVTGANSGIGRATATRLLSEGAQVLAVDLRHDRTWPDADAGRLRTLTLDISAANAADVLAQSVQARLRPRRRARQCRRHPAHRAVSRGATRRLGSGPCGQPDRTVLPQPGRRPDHGRHRYAGADRQRLLRARRRLGTQRRAVHRDERRPRGDDPHHGLRTRPAWHHGQLRAARPGTHRHERNRSTPRTSRGRCLPGCRSASPRPNGSPPRSATSRRRRPATQRGHASMSTAATRWTALCPD